MIEIRCSSLPRILSCPASIAKPGVVITGDDEAARLGTAAHITAANTVQGIETLYGETAALADEYKIDVDELRILDNLIRQCWAALKPNFPAPIVERQFRYVDEANGITLSGKPDAYSIVGTQGRIPDFKTGRTVGDHTGQLTGYAFLILDAYPELETAWGAPIHVRQREIGDPITMTRQQLQDWYGELVKTVKQDHFRPDLETCRHCPRRYACPARDDLLRSSLAVLVDPSIAPASSITAELRAGVMAAKHLKELCETYLDAAKAEVLIRGEHKEDLNAVGIDGLQVRTEERRKLNERAWEPLTMQLGIDRVKACATLSKTAVEKAIGEIAPKGMNGKLAKQTFETLEAAGAVDVSEIQKLELRPLKEIAKS